MSMVAIPVSNSTLAKRMAPPFVPGRVLGTAALTEVVLRHARELAMAFLADQQASEFSGDLVDTLPLPTWLPELDSWLPRAILDAAGFAPAPDRPGHDLVGTCGVDAHVDDVLGPVLLLCLHNDSLTFRQGRERHRTMPGQFFIFDDRIPHEVRESRCSTTYLGWAVPLVSLR